MTIILPYEDKTPVIHESAYIADNAVVAGDVEIGAQSSLWFGCVVRGDVNYIRIGERTNIQDGTIVHVASRDAGETIIGDDVTIGHAAVIHACTIENASFIGMKACVMDGAVVETGAMVAAGALVTQNKRIKSGELWAGTPAKYLRDVTVEEAKMIANSAPHYVNISSKYLATK